MRFKFVYALLLYSIEDFNCIIIPICISMVGVILLKVLILMRFEFIYVVVVISSMGFFEPLCFHHTFKSLETLSDFMHTFSPEVVKPFLYLCFSLL
jgi:hypothetical protein